MKVFRVELEDGIGPYVSNIAKRTRAVALKHLELNDRPLAGEDCLDDCLAYNEHYYCGFCNLSQYNNWFSDCLDELKEMGARLKTYEVDVNYVRFGKSGKQLVFVKDKATLIEEQVI